MTPAQKAQQTAYNEFIADYVERHGECKATRDEAHEVADRIVELTYNAITLCEKFTNHKDVVADAGGDLIAILIDDMHIDGKSEAKFLSRAVMNEALMS